MMRGALIVFEGLDRCGKSTQVDLLLKYLQNKGAGVELFKFPNRQGTVGHTIDSYLKEKLSLSDQVIHLLYSADRWEAAQLIREKLEKGTTLIVDRYAYSGVAYSSAKGLSFNWCKQPDVGLPRPDIVFYLDLPVEIAANRSGYGEERYEKRDFQENVYKQFQKLVDPTWKTVDATLSIEEINSIIVTFAEDVIKNCKQLPIKSLWTEESAHHSQRNGH